MATPSGNAIAGANPRPVRYPVQLVIMVSQEVGDRIAAEAVEHVLSKSEVARIYIEAGIDAGEAAASAGVAASVSR